MNLATFPCAFGDFSSILETDMNVRIVPQQLRRVRDPFAAARLHRWNLEWAADELRQIHVAFPFVHKILRKVVMSVWGWERVHLWPVWCEKLHKRDSRSWKRLIKVWNVSLNKEWSSHSASPATVCTRWTTGSCLLYLFHLELWDIWGCDLVLYK